MDYEWFILALSVIGLASVAGFLAGLMGIGGGIILVPGLYYIMRYMGYEPDSLMHVAIGTSLAVIVPTGISAARTHYAAGNIRMDLVKTIGSGVVIGVIAGTLLADHLSGEFLKLFFGCALILLSLMMILPKDRFRLADGGLEPFRAVTVGTFIGTVASLMGIGGATLNVPFMRLHGVPILTAIGTASCIGPLVAIPGFVGFLLIGLDADHLPPFTIGYINILAFVIIAPISSLVAIAGARVASALPKKSLTLIFVIMMIAVAIKMIHGSFEG